MQLESSSLVSSPSTDSSPILVVPFSTHSKQQPESSNLSLFLMAPKVGHLLLGCNPTDYRAVQCGYISSILAELGAFFEWVRDARRWKTPFGIPQTA